MKHGEEILTVVFDYLKILFKDENQKVFDFLDMMKNALLKKIKAKEEETGETRDFMDKLIENMQKNKEIRKEVRKSILEDLLKNDEDEDEDVKIYSLIGLLVAKINQILCKQLAYVDFSVCVWF